MLFSFLLEGGFLILLLYFFSINIFLCGFLSKKKKNYLEFLGPAQSEFFLLGKLIEEIFLL